MGFWGPCPVGSRRRAPSGGSGAKLPEADNTLLFCHGFKNDSDTCIHCLQVFNTKWKKVNLEAEKW